MTYQFNGPLPNRSMPQPPKFRDISRELWSNSSSVTLEFNRWKIFPGLSSAMGGSVNLSGTIRSHEEIEHPGSHVMHASIVWLVTSWEERPSVDDARVYWITAVSVANIADVVALLQAESFAEDR